MKLRFSYGFFITLAVFVLCLAALLSRAQDKPSVPKLTDAQKLEIRNAQVEMFQAKTVLESTPQFQAFQRAQSHLNDTSLRIQRESKVDATKWTLGQDLEYTAVPQPKKKK